MISIVAVHEWIACNSDKVEILDAKSTLEVFRIFEKTGASTCDEAFSKHTGLTMTRQDTILRFIDNFTTNKGKLNPDDIVQTFSSGYCYYFAVILKEAFGGEIVWPKYHSHIVWHDTVDNICYDIWGVYKDYVETDLIPINVLSCKNLALFRHVDETTFTDEDSFKEQCLINEYEFSKGWPLSRYIDNSMLEFPITKVKGDTYEYDIKSATLKPIRSSGFDDFVKDNNLNPTYLGWIKR